jgi:hypothetical protein
LIDTENISLPSQNMKFGGEWAKWTSHKLHILSSRLIFFSINQKLYGVNIGNYFNESYLIHILSELVVYRIKTRHLLHQTVKFLILLLVQCSYIS